LARQDSQKLPEKGIVHRFERQARVTNDALNLGIIALWLRLKRTGCRNGTYQERLLLDDPSDQMHKMTPRDGLQIRQVLLKPGLKRFQGGCHIVQWLGLVHSFLSLIGV
jgi:hypothetical protein